MGFGTAISTCFSKYATFSGRARRSEFWYWVLFIFIIAIITNILDSLLGTKINLGTVGGVTSTTYYNNVGWITLAAELLLFLPGLAVQVRRLHDTGRSGWWWWLNIICCIGTLILFIMYLGDSTAANRYGPNPKTANPYR
ncbi:MAG: DUF805 domain-containing protein [Actinomycetes bacterium]